MAVGYGRLWPMDCVRFQMGQQPEEYLDFTAMQHDGRWYLEVRSGVPISLDSSSSERPQIKLKEHKG
jgi:hypothetical protein